jgi:hypothetical protein
MEDLFVWLADPQVPWFDVHGWRRRSRRRRPMHAIWLVGRKIPWRLICSRDPVRRAGAAQLCRSYSGFLPKKRGPPQSTDITFWEVAVGAWTIRTGIAGCADTGGGC